MPYQGPNCWSKASPEMLSALKDTTVTAGFNNHSISVIMGWSGNNSCNYEMLINGPNSNKLSSMSFNYINNYMNMYYLDRYDQVYDSYENSNPYFYSTTDDGFVHFSENSLGNLETNIEFISLDAPPSGVYTVNFAYYGFDPICGNGNTVTFLIKYGNEQISFDYPIHLVDKNSFGIRKQLKFNVLFENCFYFNDK